MQGTVHQTASVATRRTAIRRSIGVRVIAAIVLIAFVCFVGDMRRRHIAMSQMKRYTTALNVAIGESGVVPLNLDASQWLGADEKPINMNTLSRTEVACLRDRPQAIMIAWTVGLVQVLGVNGRSIVTYHDGRAESSWVSESEFEALERAQRKTLDSCE